MQARAIRSAVNLTCWMTPPLMAEIAARWIADGTAARLTEMQREQAARRQAIAHAVLADHDVRADRFGLHLWLDLPPEWSAEAFRTEAEHRSVKVVEGAAFAAESGMRPKNVRVCVSHEADEARLRTGLTILAGILREAPPPSALVL